jgi:hypothetical protein
MHPNACLNTHFEVLISERDKLTVDQSQPKRLVMYWRAFLEKLNRIGTQKAYATMRGTTAPEVEIKCQM